MVVSPDIHAHVAHLQLVRDAAEDDDGPVLKFKRRGYGHIRLAHRISRQSKSVRDSCRHDDEE